MIGRAFPPVKFASVLSLALLFASIAVFNVRLLGQVCVPCPEIHFERDKFVTVRGNAEYLRKSAVILKIMNVEIHLDRKSVV